MDPYRIDSHKLHLHPERVAAWKAGENVPPIYMEMSPVGACNHRCTFCGVDFMGYKNRRLDTAMLRQRLPEMGAFGLKSIMFAGEGEPLLHPDIVAITRLTRESGIDPSFTTNGVFLGEAVAEGILPVTEWIKISINAGTAASYAAIHRTKEGDFAKVLANIKRAVEIRAFNGYRCTIGMQMVLLPENRAEAVDLARTARDLGVDYLVVKPYSQHIQSITRAYAEVRYEEDLALGERLAEFDSERFHVVFRAQTMRKWDTRERPYDRCLSLPFWSYIDAGGDVWGCSVYLKDERFLYGNIATQSFPEIWAGEKRRASLEWVHTKLDVSQCRVNCRMDAVNRYLWEVRNPPAHANFI